ncbi:hypothetical protein IWQ60_007279 [Tieghemiomyces parasiticus]|uniref:Zn(2)-C6 fungal-type domain-containing protein n=1 Tax=Tieghemiomyces parasiticus TaxID=78921 RepID=A0A9W7ZYC4_9FUNG|nr:hypothetical protein IWQ60_007279 [Tieghemiomyces parasiticus]
MFQAAGPKLRRACDRCTEKKIKCDNQRPCAGCWRKGHLCHYSPAYQSTLKTIKVAQVNPGFNVLIQTTTSLNHRTVRTVSPPTYPAQAHAQDGLPVSPLGAFQSPPATSAPPSAAGLLPTAGLDADTHAFLRALSPDAPDSVASEAHPPLSHRGLERFRPLLQSIRALGPQPSLTTAYDILYNRDLLHNVISRYYARRYRSGGQVFFEHFWYNLQRQRVTPLTLNTILVLSIRYTLDFHREVDLDVASVSAPYLEAAEAQLEASLARPTASDIFPLHDLMAYHLGIGDSAKSAAYAGFVDAMAAQLQHDYTKAATPDPLAALHREIQRSGYWLLRFGKALFSVYHLTPVEHPTGAQPELPYVDFARMEHLMRACMESGSSWDQIPVVIPSVMCCMLTCPEVRELTTHLIDISHFIRRRYMRTLQNPVGEIRDLARRMDDWYAGLQPPFSLPTPEEAHVMAAESPHVLTQLLQVHTMYYSAYMMIYLDHPLAFRIKPLDGLLPDPNEVHRSVPVDGRGTTEFEENLAARIQQLKDRPDLSALLDVNRLSLEVAERFRLQILPLYHLISPRRMGLAQGTFLFYMVYVYIREHKAARPPLILGPRIDYRAVVLEMADLLYNLGFYWPIFRKLAVEVRTSLDAAIPDGQPVAAGW